MEDTVDKIILFPRFTAFAGAGTFRTAPLNVRPYGQTILDLAITATMGSPGASAAVYVEESPDLQIWTDLAGPLSTTTPETVNFDCEWIRLRVVVSGTDPALTCWCVGDFVRRRM